MTAATNNNTIPATWPDRTALPHVVKAIAIKAHCEHSRLTRGAMPTDEARAAVRHAAAKLVAASKKVLAE